jgi:hypothetical protein
VFLQEWIHIVHQPGDLTQQVKGNTRVFEQALSHGKLDGILGLRDFDQGTGQDRCAARAGAFLAAAEGDNPNIR